MKKIFLSFSVIILLLRFYDPCLLTFGLCCIVFYFFIRHIEDQILYPRDVPASSRWCVDVPHEIPHENIFIKTYDGETLHAYFFLHDEIKRKNLSTIIFCHGNAGNIGQRLLNMSKLYKQCESNVLIFDYRGYGRSTGYPSEEGLYEDIQSVITYLTNRSDIDQEKLILFGRSLGGAVAIDAVTNKRAISLFSSSCHKDTRSTSSISRQISALILENTFTSVPDVAASIFKIIPWKSFFKLFLKNQFNSIQKMDRVSIPVLFISGDDDKLVPPSMMVDLYTNCPPLHKSMHRVRGGDHNSTWMKPGYFESINSFLSTLPSNNNLGDSNNAIKQKAYSNYTSTESVIIPTDSKH